MADDDHAPPIIEFAFKLLLSNKEAGSLIGKGGAAIVALQSRFGCKIRASHTDEFFPGTQDRVILITGPYTSVVDTVCSIIENVYQGFPEPPDAQDHSKKNPPAQLESKTITVVIPAAAGGVIIGRGGSNIKAISSKAGAHIQLENKDRQIHGLDERLIFITGNMESALISVQDILQKLSEEVASTYEHMNTNYRHLAGFVPPGPSSNGFATNLPSHMMPSHRPIAPSLMQFPPGHVQGRRMLPPGGADPHGVLMQSARGGLAPFPPPGGAPHALGASTTAVASPPSTTTLTVQLPDTVIPAIVGKAGAVIRSIQASTGARVHISAKGDFVPGTSNRLVTITGSGPQANAAYMMIAEIVGFV